jgi:hypothetical protein
MAGPADDDPNVVVVTDPEPADEAPARRRRATVGDLLEAIHQIPDAVAARVDGAGGGAQSGGVTEVTFAPEDPPEPEPEEEPAAGDGPPPAPAPSPHKPKFGFPRGRRYRTKVDIGT